jgi:hypothetical protein
LPSPEEVNGLAYLGSSDYLQLLRIRTQPRP